MSPDIAPSTPRLLFSFLRRLEKLSWWSLVVTKLTALPSRLDDPRLEVVILVTRHTDRVTQIVKTLGG